MTADDPHNPGELLPRPDPTRLTTDQLRRELGSRLEAIRLQEIINASHRRDSTNAAVVFTATVEGDRLILPWEIPPPKESVSFARHRQEGETAEFARKDDAGAAGDSARRDSFG